MVSVSEYNNLLIRDFDLKYKFVLNNLPSSFEKIFGFTEINIMEDKIIKRINVL